MLKKLLILFCSIAFTAQAKAQATYTATRTTDIQAGVDFSLARPDYGNLMWHGYGAYADVDVKNRYGLEFNVHQTSGPQTNLSERTFAVGPRIIFPIHQRFVPYAKVMFGRGDFRFSDGSTKGYNMFAIGGGVDFKVSHNLNLRLFDYERQTWPGYSDHGLTPSVISFGVAWHFGGGFKPTK
jgi:hypothetical protein